MKYNRARDINSFFCNDLRNRVVKDLGFFEDTTCALSLYHYKSPRKRHVGKMQPGMIYGLPLSRRACNNTRRKYTYLHFFIRSLQTQTNWRTGRHSDKLSYRVASPRLQILIRQISMIGAAFQRVRMEYGVWSMEYGCVRIWKTKSVIEIMSEK